MIIDTSVVMAMLFLEEDHEELTDRMLAAGELKMSVANWLEAALVVEGTKRVELIRRFDQFAGKFGIELVPVDHEQISIARLAGATFGKKHHPARLNFGDCFAYALSKASGEPLLFKGNDFAQTDVEPAFAR